MKNHRIHFTLLLILTVLLTGCGKVSETEEAIAAIGTVSMDSEAAIIYAEQLYANMSEKQQAKVENLYILINARAEYDQMEALVKNAEIAIAAIGTVTEHSEEIISTARKAYDELQKAGLESYATEFLPVLKQAENDYQTLVVQAAYDEAVSIFDAEDYLRAQDLFDAFISNHPESHLIKDAKTKAAACYLYTIESLVEEGELENALSCIDEISERYAGGTYRTQQYTDLLDNIKEKLEDIRPESGDYITDQLDSGYGEFTVENDGNYDICVKLEDTEDPDNYLLFYVRAKESTTVSVADGDYYLKYSSGQHWFGNDTMFGENASYAKSEKTCTFETSYFSTSVQYSVVTYTILSSEGGGNTRTSDIDPKDF